MEIVICRNIKRLRKQLEITQEMLAEYCGVSVQAVSKWETEQSIPDVQVLPSIAEYFNVTLDELFFGEGQSIGTGVQWVPQDDSLYVVQVINGMVLGKDRWEADKPISLKLNKKEKISLNVWGSAKIEGDVDGGVNAGEEVNCGNVGGGVNAGNGVNCGNVSGGVHAGDGVNCGNVSGGVHAGDSVSCGNISGGVSAEDSVNCGNISGNIESGNTIYCETIEKAELIHCTELYCKGDLKCDTINGNVNVEEKIKFSSTGK